MKCTVFYELSQKLYKIAAAELKKAIKAHGGEYTFLENAKDFCCPNDSEQEVPVITFQLEQRPTDIVVMKVTLSDNRIIVTGFDNEDPSAEPGEYELSDAEETHIFYITEAIRETEEIKDVSTPGFAEMINNFVIPE